MSYVQTIQNHPHRAWIFAGIGAATLICAYACYRCCCRKEKKAAVEEMPQTTPGPGYQNNDNKEESDAALAQSESKDGKDSAPPTASGICAEYLSRLGESRCPGTCGQGGKKAEMETSNCKDNEKDGVKETKSAREGGKNPPEMVRTPFNTVCPPARVGISMFKDTRLNMMNPVVTSNASTYQRDRFYRGSYNKLSSPSGAYIRHSQMQNSKSLRTNQVLKVSKGFK